MLDQQERTAVIHAAPGLQTERAAEDGGEPLVAFSARQVRGLTGLSAYQLRFWDRTELLSSPHPHAPRRKLPGRIYRFRDVVNLRVLAMLRNDCRVNLPEVRKVALWLKDRENTPSSFLRVIVRDRHIILADSAAADDSQPDGGQPIRSIEIELATVEREMRTRALQSRERRLEEIGKITRHRSVESNAWVLAGTRVPTEAVWNFHRAGHTTAAILAAYPTLTPVDIQRAIEFEQGRSHQRAS